ncbi:MAG: hypothetical protein ACFHWX_09805 [Bacteroidota bacterium]
MSIYKSFLLFVVVMGIAWLSGCINDNELDFPEDRSDEITKTVDLYSLLHYYSQNANSTDCFSIVFPLELSYSTGIIISVEDIAGLKEAIENQTNTFFIEGIILPVLVDKHGVLSSIENEDDINALLRNCGIPDLTNYLKRFKSQCFEFIYPITLINGGDTLQLENIEAYNDLKVSLGEQFLPQFAFPLKVEIFETDEVIQVTSYYQLLELINSCSQCPEGSISISPEFNGTYSFKAHYKQLDLPITYKWYINGDLVGDGDSNMKDSLLLELPEGEYQICLQSFNPDCTLGTFVCRNFTVGRPCPVLFFKQEMGTENPREYYFYADFSLQNDISYTWVVYNINNEPLYWEEEMPGEGDGKLSYEFEPGVYKVCMEKENVSADCQLAKVCAEIVVE